MSTDQYLSWEDLLAEESVADPSAVVTCVPAQNVTTPGGSGSWLPEGFELPEELRTLFAERERLERELKELTGEAESTTEDDRLKLMFQVKVHTKETRIEERRERQREEQKRMLEKRIMEARLMQARLELRREKLREELRRKAAEDECLRENWVREREKAREEAERRRASEASWQSRRELLAQARKEFWEGSSVQRDARSFEAAREAGIQRALEARKAVTLSQRALGQCQEQPEFDERREAQRRSALEDAMQRRREARAFEEEREIQRQHLRDQLREEHRREQRRQSEIRRRQSR